VSEASPPETSTRDDDAPPHDDRPRWTSPRTLVRLGGAAVAAIGAVVVLTHHSHDAPLNSWMQSYQVTDSRVLADDLTRLDHAHGSRGVATYLRVCTTASGHVDQMMAQPHAPNPQIQKTWSAILRAGGAVFADCVGAIAARTDARSKVLLTKAGNQLVRLDALQSQFDREARQLGFTIVHP
jgi:hypothetical protein